ncbi:TonB-dependent receptor [Mucilaginibacter mali]|uniref:TonB-dependent receptor n=1 Tax=Mucilaginibacter mali TaxID=2740462 RepID=A0A7D4UPF2_9SPHI|nr:TonB-dependent receptor [Mucilaginibacter mali]QKJ30400.1 TonB-dependent receptor [Mucilaginibacter mali]
MKLHPLIILMMLLCSARLFAQSPYHIKGAVADTSSKTRLTNATVCVLNAKDSIIRRFVYAKEGGSFAINNLPPGNFILLVSYPAYADYVEKFTLDPAHPTKDFGSVNMPLKSRLLHDVIVKGTVNAIKIKGDTTEFSAKAYVIQPNDKVEDLLKQLPGIQVDKDGKITANGQTVSKVLVDGDEFFGDDPTLVTKNLRADMVDKVQLFDKKSDQAAFTGVDDGKRTKTINIQLKEDKKNGTFGKLDGGLATQKLYESQAIYNRFKAKAKYSAYGTSANNGKIGLGFADNNALGSSANSVQIDDGGGIIVFGGSSDGLDSFDGTYFGNGKPLAHNGGLHYDSKWNGDKETINTNYRIGSMDINGLTTTTTQQTLTNGIINTNSRQGFNNYAFRNKAEATYTIKIDTTSNLKIGADGAFKNFRVMNNYQNVTDNGNGKLINFNDRDVNNHGDQQLFNASLFYTKKFKKVGRNISWNISESYNNNETKGNLNSRVDFYNTTSGGIDSTQRINQYKTSDVLSSVLNSNITYGEPLTKFASMVFNYGFALNNSTADRKSFNQDAAGNYTIFDNVYSNDYKLLRITNQFGASYTYRKKKFNTTLSAKASIADYKQTDEYTMNTFSRSYVNWLPRASFQYSPSLQKSITFSYSGFSQQPGIDQIQPIRVNTDPLNITLGNANLKPAYSQNFSVYYNSAKIISGTSSYGSVYFYNQYDAIVNNTVTDAKTGKTTIQYINLTDRSPYNYSASFSTSRKIKSIGLSTGIRLNTNGNINYSYINNALNETKSRTYGASLNLSKSAVKKYDLYVSGGPSYTFNEFSLQPTANNNAAGFNAFGNASYYLPAKFLIRTDAQYTYTAATRAFDAQRITLWNASLTKTFFKDDALAFAVNATDLLNNNLRTNRYANANMITQTNNSGIGRYVMFSVIWNFTKFATEPAKN